MFQNSTIKNLRFFSCFQYYKIKTQQNNVFFSKKNLVYILIFITFNITNK